MYKHVIVLFLALSAALAQAPAPSHNPPPRKVPGAQNAAAAPKTPEGIVNFLVPDNVAYPERLGQVPPADAIAALKKAQSDAAGTRGDAIAYLLMLLGSEPDANRTHLFDSLRGCGHDPDNCDERVVAYLGNLFDRGDKLVVDPLLDAGQTTDTVMAEALGSAYDDMIARDARAFLAGVSRHSASDQRRLCKIMANGDGGGMPDETAADVQAELQKLSREVGPVSSAAMTCLNEVRAAAK